MEWIINHEKVDAGFLSKIILSQEAFFTSMALLIAIYKYRFIFLRCFY